jgi:hypothetical protein
VHLRAPVALTHSVAHPCSDGPAGPADVSVPSRHTSNVSSSSQVPKLEKAKLKKQKREKNSTLIQEISGYWEQLRQTSTGKEKKVELVGKILDACGDRLGDVAASHTASRIIQSCVKHGNVGQRERVQEAVLGSGRGVVELSKNPYSRFVVSKLIMTAGKGQLAGTWWACDVVR